jgi:hypothetical protein
MPTESCALADKSSCIVDYLFASAFILLGDRRAALDRQGIFSCGFDTCRRCRVSNRSEGNRTIPFLYASTTN